METRVNNEMNITKCIENLAPVTNGENQEIYIELLNKGINDKKVKNIALSGSYGSGKSSIIQKFLPSPDVCQRKEKYLEISLANFDKNIKPEDEEQLIEKSILQQIFYKVSKSELPYSKLERTEKKSNSSIIWNTIVFFVWLVSFYIFIKASEINKSYPDLFTLHDLNLQTFNLILLFVSTFYIIYIIVKGTGKIKLNKLSFQGVNLDIEDTKGSLLNQYLDEILYFFESTTYEVLIIEDLDRQDGTKIFQKLREINTLLNNYTKIKNQKKITFIYAVKDSIFTGEERTKFFELIIPVVPIINTSNAKDILIQKFTEIGILDKLGKDFIKDISYYVQNYRQLTNIVNEFCVYQKALKNNQDLQKLFALISYKNFFPKDFSDLQNRKGMLYKVFHEEKLKIQEKLIQTLNGEIKSLEERLKNIKKENLNDERELKLIFASKLFEEVNDLKLFEDNGLQVTIIQLVDNEELFNKYVVNGGDLKYFYENRYNYVKTTDFKGDKSREYEKRLKILRDKTFEKNNTLSKEKEKIQSEIREIKYKKLFEVIESVDDKTLLSIENLAEKNELKEEDRTNWKLIVKLIIDGYIDEEYSRYISYFHEGELTRNDYDFIAKIKGGDNLDFVYTLDNIEEVINELSINDFKNNIENFALAEYIFSKNTTDDKRKYFINNFFEKSSEVFIRELIEKNLEDQKMISYMLKEASKKTKINKLFNIISNENNSIKKLLVNVINNLDSFDLLLNDKKEFDNLLSSLLFDIYNEIEDIKSIEKYLLDEQIIFDELSDLKYQHSKELFEFIYINSLHSLTYENIESILVNLFDFKISEEFKLKTLNLTTIRECKAKELLDDINENIDLYYENCWSVLVNNTQESEETLLYLLNHKELKNEYKKEIIRKSENRITDITTIDDKDLWEVLFNENKVEADWNNILYYYQELELEEVDNTLIQYLNNEENYIELGKSKINNEIDFNKDTILQDFNTKLILSKDLTDESYNNLIKSIWFISYKRLSLEKLSKSKIDSILSTKILSLTQDNIDNLKEYFSPMHVTLIENMKNEFLEKLNEFSLNSNDVLSILNSLKFSDDEKYQIIEGIDLSIFEDNTALKQKASELYIVNNRKIDNLKLFEKLFYKSDSTLNEWALKLYTSQIDSWTYDECQTYITEFDKPYNELLEKSATKLYIEDTELNRLLLQKLQEKDCISSYNENKKALGKNNLKIERKRV